MRDGWKDRLSRKLDYLNPDVRRRVVDDVLLHMTVPSLMMIEYGSIELKRQSGVPWQTKVSRVWDAMVGQAREGG